MRKTMRVGIIIPDITQPFFSEMIRAAQQIATFRDYDILIGNTNRNRELESHYLRLVTERQIDGVILTSVDFEDKLLDHIVTSSFPVVFVNNPHPTAECPCVRTDSELGGYMAGKHLLDQGHREIAFIGAESRAYFNSKRIQGFRRALAGHGVPFDEGLLYEGEFTEETGYRFTREMLLDKRNFTAIFAATDMIAIGAMRALAEHGVGVPEDVSVVGFDDLVFARFPGIELTTVRQEVRTVGSTAMTWLLDLLEGRNEMSNRPHTVAVPPQLIVRETTARPPGA